MKENRHTTKYYPGYLKGEKKDKYHFEELSNIVIGAAIKVHKELGPGFLESIYEEALKILLTENNISFEKQKEIKITFHGSEIGVHRLDLLIENQIILELKAVKELLDIHMAQLRSYLQATGLKTGLLINFARPKIQIKRIVN
jgi:GxxExxY protein